MFIYVENYINYKYVVSCNKKAQNIVQESNFNGHIEILINIKNNYFNIIYKNAISSTG